MAGIFGDILTGLAIEGPNNGSPTPGSTGSVVPDTSAKTTANGAASSGNSGVWAQANQYEATQLQDDADALKVLNTNVGSYTSDVNAAAQAADQAINIWGQDAETAYQQQDASRLSFDLNQIKAVIALQSEYSAQSAQQMQQFAQQYESLADSGNDSTGSSSTQNLSGSASQGSDTLLSSLTSGSGLSSTLPMLLMMGIMPAMMIPSLVSGTAGAGARQAGTAAPGSELAGDTAPPGADPNPQGASATSTGDAGGDNQTHPVADAHTQPVADAHTEPASSSEAVGNGAPVGPNTGVGLGDGSTMQARNTREANGVRAARNDADPAAPDQQADMNLPLTGTPIPHPVAPQRLAARRRRSVERSPDDDARSP